MQPVTLRSGPDSAARADSRVQPYGPLAVSLVLHLVALLLIAPWLVMRSVPAPPVEVEVMLEPATPEPRAARPERAVRAAAQSRPAPVPPARAQPVKPPLPVAAPKELPKPSPTPATQPGQGLSGRAALAAREAAGLSAPRKAVAPSPVAPRHAGDEALQRGTQVVRPVLRTPSLGSAPQPSARSAAVPSRPGENRTDGPLTIAGPAAQSQAAEPEFRQAARQGGQSGIRGGSRALDDGLSRLPGSPEQQALVAARAVPRSTPGATASGGSQQPALAAPPVSLGTGQGRVAAAESLTPGAARLASAGVGQAPMGASRAPAATGSGRGSGPGGASRSAGPAERGSGLMQAGAPAAAGSGAALAGGGQGASVTGEGRAQQLAGGGGGVREAATPLLNATDTHTGARQDQESGTAQLSGRADSAAPAQPVREARLAALQTEQASGEARVIEERFNAPALKVNSPRSICELPLMFAGFDRKPIPQGLDSINATAASLPDETPPRHHPGNQLPRYPFQALGSRAEGRVVVRAEVQADGRVGQSWIKQSSGAQTLDLAALDTVRGWRFHPGQRHGMAVAMWLDVPIEYKLP
ncbi:MAG TPA: TonB family protein [Thiobacillus sp.]|nr:TonB family protein [Thiobacillus sp.]